VDINYILELNDGGRILGGEWIQDPQTSWGEDSKKLHPDFAWMAISPIGPGENADDTGGSGDNPFVSYPNVQALLRCANEPASCSDEPVVDPSDSVCQGNCGGGPFVDQGKSCYCDSACTSYGDCCGGYAAVCEGQPDPDPDPDPTGPSCAGHCGQASPVPGSSPACYCDSACKSYGDCCDDVDSVCTN
jgi:hypothetical protein